MKPENQFLLWMLLIGIVGVGVILITSESVSLQYKMLYYAAGGSGFLLSFLLARRYEKKAV